MAIGVLTGRAAAGVAAFAACALAGAVSWVNQKSAHLEEDTKGPLADRCRETAQAIIQKNRRGDEALPEKHVELVSGLSSGRYAEAFAHLTKEEESKLATKYFAEYLFQATERGSGTETPVFRCTRLPPLEEKRNEGFVFSGKTDRLFDIEARAQILSGDYICCEGFFPTKKQGRYSPETVILTGTTSPTCSVFRQHLLRDLAWMSAHEPLSMSKRGVEIDSQHLLSDTPVVELLGESFYVVGNLSGYPESTKEKIRSGIFTPCPFYTLRKKGSERKYMALGAIAVGTRDPKACKALLISNLLRSYN